MSTPTQPEWTLSGKHTHGTDGQLLVGCHITKNAANTAYLFTQPGGTQLASSPGTTLPTAGFTFTPAFDYNGLTGVSITMDAPPASTSDNWHGTWTCTGSPPMHTPPPTGPQSGDFTAQAGSKLSEASSAKA